MFRIGITLMIVLTCTNIASAQHRPKSPARGQVQIPTTVNDFYHSGSQPDPTWYDYIKLSSSCSSCHKFDNDDNPTEVVPPYNNWVSSFHAQSARDPVFHAALTIANQDANDAGVTCIGCHMPGGFIQGRAIPSDGSALIYDDFDGISCDVCHRMVDPVEAAENPSEDESILDYLALNGDLPFQPGNGNFIIDPTEVRRGPLEDVYNVHGADILVSPYHSEAAFCAPCHDVSNPTLSLNKKDGSFLPNALDAPHPSGNVHDMMPEQRTYSEWLNSSFATQDGVNFPDGRFTNHEGGTNVGNCQECHMPATDGGICVYWPFPDFGTRENTAEHSFIGANSWVLDAVRNLYDDSESGLDDDSVALHHQRTELLMEKASDMDLSVDCNGRLNVRITNWSGHKLPTGYPEGRRMWLYVKFLDSDGNTIAERGLYDYETADLTTSDTKVYETHVGMTSEMSKITGLDAGESFHLVLNNIVLSDNRIPPHGFTNAAFEAIQAGPVNYSYDDWQHWDDTLYDIPSDASQAVVTLFHQTSSKEYMEFLRDANFTDDKGQIAYDQWVLAGKSSPIVMDSGLIDIDVEPVTGDVNGDCVVDVSDLLIVIGSWGPCKGCSADVNNDGDVDVNDLLLVIANWG